MNLKLNRFACKFVEIVIKNVQNGKKTDEMRYLQFQL